MTTRKKKSSRSRATQKARNNPTQLDEPAGWRSLWERAQRECNPKKLAALIDKMNQLLSEHEKRASANQEKPRSGSKGRSPNN